LKFHNNIDQNKPSPNKWAGLESNIMKKKKDIRDRVSEKVRRQKRFERNERVKERQLKQAMPYK